MSGAEPMLWAWKSAPVKSLVEKGILLAYAERADADGCNAAPSVKTVAKRALCDTSTVKRHRDELIRRGLLTLGDQRAVAHIDEHLRPVVYDVMIPYEWFPDIADINNERAQRGRAPLTREERPNFGPAPARAERSDKKNRSSDPGAQSTPPAQSPPVQEGGALSPRGLSVPEGGGSQPPDLPIKETFKELSLPPLKGGEKAGRAHTPPRTSTHTREEDPQPALIPKAPSPADTRSRIQTAGAGGTGSAGNELGRRWHEFLSEKGIPFPSSAPGAKFTKFAEFTQMLSATLRDYPSEEVWNALVALYERRSEVFPSRGMLARELASVRRGLRAVPDVGVELELVASPEVAALTERAFHWWTVEEGNYVPSSQVASLRGLMAGAFERGASEWDVANTLRACAQAGKACPQDFTFANVLSAIRQGADADMVMAAAGVKLSAPQARKLRNEASEVKRRDSLEVIKAAMGYGAPSDAPNEKIIIGEVS